MSRPAVSDMIWGKKAIALYCGLQGNESGTTALDSLIKEGLPCTKLGRWVARKEQIDEWFKERIAKGQQAQSPAVDHQLTIGRRPILLAIGLTKDMRKFQSYVDSGLPVFKHNRCWAIKTEELQRWAAQYVETLAAGGGHGQQG